MNAKSTPGPWSAEYRDHQEDFYVTDADGGWVCTLPASRYDDQIENRDDPEARANARLIAAAPDLLEALVRVVASSDMHPVHLEQAIGLARASIAKATGEQS